MRSVILVLLCISIFFSCKKSDEDFNKIENEIVIHIQNNDWNTLFDLIKKEGIPDEFKSIHRQRLKELSKDIVINYKEFKLKELHNKKDTILYGFILNSTSQDFKNRISELRKENNGGFEWGKYSFKNSFLGYKYELSGYKQHLISDEVDCDIILSRNKGKKFTSLRVKDFNSKSNNSKFKYLLSSNYGRWFSVPSNYNYEDKIKLFDWESVYSRIKSDSFNVFRFFFMINNSDVFKFEKYKNHDIIFNSNFVIDKDIISSRFLTYEMFFKEYEQTILDMKDEIQKSSVEF